VKKTVIRLAILSVLTCVSASAQYSDLLKYTSGSCTLHTTEAWLYALWSGHNYSCAQQAYYIAAAGTCVAPDELNYGRNCNNRCCWWHNVTPKDPVSFTYSDPNNCIVTSHGPLWIDVIVPGN
jgi:hypothetical protein